MTSEGAEVEQSIHIILKSLINNEVGCSDNTVSIPVDTRRHCKVGQEGTAT